MLVQLKVLEDASATHKTQIDILNNYWRERYDNLTKDNEILKQENQLLKESIPTTENSKEISKETVKKTINREENDFASEAIYVNENDLIFFEKVIQAEFGDASYATKQMGANVVINRHLASGQSIRSVLEAPHQFSVVENGAIYKVKVDQDTKKAIQSILLGERVFNQAVKYFWDEHLSKSHALWEKEIVARAEGTIFAKN